MVKVTVKELKVRVTVMVKVTVKGLKVRVTVTVKGLKVRVRVYGYGQSCYPHMNPNGP